MPKLSHHRARQLKAQLTEAGTIDWRVPVLCIIFSLFIAGLNTPLVRVLIAQARAMDPYTSEVTNDTLRALQSKISSENKIIAVRSVFRELTSKTASPLFDRYRQVDPENGLYSYLQLLVQLRKSSATQPAEAMAAFFNPTKVAAAARLYQTFQRDLAEQFLRDRQLSARVSAMESQRVSHRFASFFEYHRPVLRELTDELIQLGTQWRAANHPKEALLAHQTVLELFSDLVKDSPTPDIALLAAERLPLLMRELTQDAKAAGLDIASDTEAAARSISQFVHNWHKESDEAGPGIIPWTGDVAIASKSHESMVRGFLAALLVGLVWLVLLLAVLLLAVVLLLAQRDSFPLEHMTGRSAWRAAVITCAPLAVLLALRAHALPLVWIFTIQSAVPAMLLPLSVLLFLGPSARMAVRVKANTVDPRRPVRTMTIISLVFIATLVLTWFLPANSEAWQPPIIIQRFRKLGVLLVAECFIFLLVWFIWGQWRRRSAGRPAGILAHANFQVAARSLLLITLASTAILGMNRFADDRHQAAFARATADPISDRLGANWRETYFGPVAAVLQRLESSK